MNYKKQALLNTIGNVFYLMALWVLTVIITRTLGYEKVGIFNLATSVGGIFYSLQLYGMRSYQVSDATNEFSPNQYINSRYLSCLIGFILCFLSSIILGYTKEKVVVIMLLMLYRTAEVVSDAYFGEMQKRARLDILAKSMISKSILTLIIFIGLISFCNNLWMPMLGIAILAVGITVLYDYRKYRQIVEGSDNKVSFKDSWKPLKICFTLMLATFFPIVVTNMPRIVLEKNYGEELLGYYGNVSAPTVLIITIVPTVLTPFMTMYGELILNKNFGKLVKCFVISLLVTMAFGGVCALGVFLLGNPVMELLFSEKIAPYVHYLYPLIASMVVYSFTMCGNSILISLRKNNLVMFFSFVAMIVCIICSLIFIKPMAINGVIISMSLAYAVHFIIQVVYISVWYNKQKTR